MTKCRNIILRGKTIVPERVTRGVTKVLDRVAGRVGISLPSIIGEPMPAPPTVDTVIIADAESGVVTDGFLDPIGGLAPMNVARFANYATRVAKDPNAPIEKSPSLLTRGLRLFIRPLDRLVGGLTMSAMPRLHFHGRDPDGPDLHRGRIEKALPPHFHRSDSPYATTRIALPLINQDALGVASVNWGRLKGEATTRTRGIITLLAKVIAQNPTPDLSEIRIYLHSGKPSESLSLSEEWFVHRNNEGKEHEEWYALHMEERVLVINLFEVSTQRIEKLMKEGLLTEEIAFVHHKASGESNDPVHSVPVERYFRHLRYSTTLYLASEAGEIFIRSGGGTPDLLKRIHPIMVKTPSDLKGKRFRIDTTNPYEHSHLLGYLELMRGEKGPPDIHLRSSVSIPADDAELLEREARRMYSFIHEVLVSVIKENYLTFRSFIFQAHTLDLQIYLTRTEAGVEELGVDDGISKVRIKLPLDFELRDGSPVDPKRIKRLLLRALLNGG